ncbi:hypothetical protein, partial [Enterobacter cloacae complex sp. 4DZ3-28B]|uniref:hypothetical protein n=1 Tax=Enterobacter cloacae complex sp. 4DZ3-28B TaxID=2511989 RepID=UPI0010258879
EQTFSIDIKTPTYHTEERLSNKFLTLLVRDIHEKSDIIDTIYGVRIEGGTTRISDSTIEFKNKNVIVKDNKFAITEGLLELLFKKKADIAIIQQSDLNNYKSILTLTNAHRKDWNQEKPIRYNASRKYRNYIKEMFKDVPKKGGNLPEYMIVEQNHKIDYVHWDAPNELVDRLRLLIASQAAGNSSLSNEILSIIEELREANIIY